MIFTQLPFPLPLFMKRFYFVLILLFSLCFSVPTASAQTTNDSPLVSREKLEIKIKGGETQNFYLKADSGEAVAIVVEQQQIDVTVAVYDPGDEKINEAEFSFGEIGTERLFFFTDKAGVYRIEVRAVDKSASASGGYKIYISDERAATEQDRKENSAVQTLLAGTKISEKGTAESFAEAARHFEEAAAIWRATGNERGAAQALYYKTIALFNIGDRKNALAAALESLELFRKIGDRVYEAETLYNVAATELGLGEPQKSIEDFNRSLAIFRELKIPAGEAKVLSQMAIVYSQQGNFRRAIEITEQAVPLNRAVNNMSAVAVSLNTL